MSDTDKKTPVAAATACSAFGLYRPNGSLCRVILSESLSDGQEDSILSRAWNEIQPADDFRAGTPRPEAEQMARSQGWRVLPVTIMPNAEVSHGDRERQPDTTKNDL